MSSSRNFSCASSKRRGRRGTQELEDRGCKCHRDWYDGPGTSEQDAILDTSVNTRTPDDTKTVHVAFVYEWMDILIASNAVDHERNRLEGCPIVETLIGRIE